jgi:hypothetical protein
MPPITRKLSRRDALGTLGFAPGLVSGTRDAQPRAGVRERRRDRHDADRVSGRGERVFADGTQYEMATLSGDASSGYTATLTIGFTS